MKHPEKMEADRPKKLCFKEGDWKMEGIYSHVEAIDDQEEQSSEVK